MSNRLPDPAQTYTMNTLASVVGRYGVADPSESTLQQVGDMLDVVIDDLERSDQPAVPHTDRELLLTAADFDRKLLAQIHEGPAASYMSAARQKAVSHIVRRHLEFCTGSVSKEGTGWEQLVDPQDIAKAYGLPGLWQNSEQVIQTEIDTWGRATSHPLTPPTLTRQVEIGETRDLMGLMWDKVVEAPRHPEVRTYLTDEPQNYHVFWAPVDGGLDYATPRLYDRATQLSFDLPHNATHLTHLDTMDGAPGAARYDDSMAVRAYFEATTVFSEYRAYQVASQDESFGVALADIFDEHTMTGNELATWVAADRRYEFKLRAARYAADTLLINGIPFRDTVAKLQEQFGIPELDAEDEARKYIAWTGLGAVYTYGYRQHLANGITRTIDAIQDSQGHAITTWSEAAATKTAD